MTRSRHLQAVPDPVPTRTRGPVGVWLIAGTPVDEPYPCRCGVGNCNPRYCPCSGRTDLEHLPPACCAHHNTPPVAAAAQNPDRPAATHGATS